MDFNPSLPYEQKGYLNCDYKFFHINETKKVQTDWHYHDFDKIVFFLQGKAAYAIEGRKYDLKPYDIVLVPKNNIHSVEALDSSKYERYILYLKPEIYDQIEEFGGGDKKTHLLKNCFEIAALKKTNVVHFDAATSAFLLKCFQELEECLNSSQNSGKEPFAQSLKSKIILARLLIMLNEACVSCKDAFMEKARYNRKVIDIIDYISANLGNDLSIDQIADRFYISKYHMMRVFKNETGYSVHQYIMEKRILLARDLIISGMPAMTASLESGFRDYSSFCKAFQKQTGHLPSEYGNECANSCERVFLDRKGNYV